MKTLHLHIGHGKTGSSFLQSIFSMNRDFLKESCSIDYPVYDKDQSRLGMISSGNAAVLLKALQHRTLPEFLAETSAPSLLFSSEFLYHDPSWLTEESLFNRSHFNRISVLLFIRDPIEILSSSYQQSVKRGGYFGTLDEYALGFRFFKNLVSVITRLQEKARCELQIVNYSRGRPVEEVAASWLGTPPFPTIPDKKINRSLSFSELFVQREFNRHFGKSGDLISDALCTQLPDYEGYHAAPSEYAWEEFLQRERPFINKVNALVPETEHLALEPRQMVPEIRSDVSLNADQLSVIVRQFGKHLVRRPKKVDK